jgi:hypothetical protein
MILLIIGCVLTTASWIVAWGRFQSHDGVVPFPLWLGYILSMNGLAETIAGTLLLARMGWSFCWLFAVPVPFWWFFECMKNRSELALPLSTPDLIASYFFQASLDFSTVVPTALSTSFFA